MDFPSAHGLRTKAEATLTPGHEPKINVSPVERMVSAIGGGLLTAYGIGRTLKNFSPAGVLSTLAGGAVLYRGVSGYCPAYGSLGISTAKQEAAGLRITGTVTIDQSADELYAFWRHLENLPSFMHHLESVRQLDDRVSQWRVRLPGGLGSLDWQAEITRDQPGTLLAWRSMPEARLENSGRVEFRKAPLGRGTEVHAVLEYRPPAGMAGTAAIGLANPLFAQMVREDIRRFKNLMEAGEIPTVAGQPAGR